MAVSNGISALPSGQDAGVPRAWGRGIPILYHAVHVARKTTAPKATQKSTSMDPLCMLSFRLLYVQLACSQPIRLWPTTPWLHVVVDLAQPT